MDEKLYRRTSHPRWVNMLGRKRGAFAFSPFSGWWPEILEGKADVGPVPFPPPQRELENTGEETGD